MESKPPPQPLRFINHQALFAAVRSGDLQSVKTHLTDPASISSLMSLQNEAGETLLYIAAEGNLVEVFGYLLGFCDVEVVKIRSRSDMNAFHVAAKLGHLSIVKQLRDAWPEICTICDLTNTSPLYTAAVKNHLDIVRAILDVDASTIRIVRKNGKTSLHTAARYGYLDMVKLLIDKDPGIICIKDKKGQTALHMAVKGHSAAVVEEMLLVDGTILNERDKKGNTAVHIATRKSRPQILSLLLRFKSVDVNAINNQKETAMDLADKLQYGEATLEIKEALAEVGAKHARHVGRLDEAMELKRTVSDIKHEVQSQLLQNEKTQRRVSGIAKELRKLHRDAVQTTTNSVTVVATLFASIAFLAIFNLPGQYLMAKPEAGKANIAKTVGFQIFIILNAFSLFISLAVVVVQITLVAWETSAQKQVVSVVNKLMWAAAISTCGAFLSIAFIIVGKGRVWMPITITLMAAPILVGTLAIMCYFVFRQRFNNDSQRRIRRGTGSKSFSWSTMHSAHISDSDEYNSDHKKICVL